MCVQVFVRDLRWWRKCPDARDKDKHPSGASLNDVLTAISESGRLPGVEMLVHIPKVWAITFPWFDSRSQKESIQL